MPDTTTNRRDRGAVGLPEVIGGLFTLVALTALAPFFLRFAGMASAEADPFSALLLQLAVPLLFVALIVGIGGAASS
jgi:hypothetical protein